MTKRPRRSPEQNHFTHSHQADAFFDLTKLNHPPTGTWNIVLHLGNGMELQLSNA